MMKVKKYFTVLAIMFGIVSLAFSANVTDQKKELDQLKSQIKANKDIVNKKEKEKQKVQKDVKVIKTKLDATGKKINDLTKTEKKVVEKIILSKQEIDKTVNKINTLSDVGQNEFLRLLYLDNQDKYFQDTNPDKLLLSFLVSATIDRINNFENKRDSLEYIKIQKERDVKAIQWNKTLETKKSQEFNYKISELNKNIQQIESDKKKYLASIQKLQQDARALEALITKLQRQEKEKRKTQPEKQYTYKFTDGRLSWPVKGTILKTYGLEKDAKYNVSTMSNGIDIGVPEGTQVIAADDGEVVFSEYFSGAGKLVIIDHKNGYHTLYSYNSSLLVNKGDKVKKKQAIALSGKSGSAKVPSVHFEVRKGGVAVNPMQFLN